jgi:hypothetical protein
MSNSQKTTDASISEQGTDLTSSESDSKIDPSISLLDSVATLQAKNAVQATPSHLQSYMSHTTGDPSNQHINHHPFTFVQNSIDTRDPNLRYGHQKPKPPPSFIQNPAATNGYAHTIGNLELLDNSRIFIVYINSYRSIVISPISSLFSCQSNN